MLGYVHQLVPNVVRLQSMLHPWNELFNKTSLFFFSNIYYTKSQLKQAYTVFFSRLPPPALHTPPS